MTVTDDPTAAIGLQPKIRRLLENEPPAGEVIDRVAVQRFENVAVVTLSYPAARNALNLASWQRLRAVFDELATDGALRAVVLRGAGGEALAAGADISWPTGCAPTCSCGCCPITSAGT